MAMIRVDIETVVIGGGPVASLVVLKPRPLRDGTTFEPLPIRLGATEASAIGMGVERPKHDRPMTHDLLRNTLRALGATLTSVAISKVEGTTFYAQLNLTTQGGQAIAIDARPSDAISMAIRCKAPMFVEESVLNIASYPDFDMVRREEAQKNLEEFQSFLEDLSPDDFLTETEKNG